MRRPTDNGFELYPENVGQHPDHEIREDKPRSPLLDAHVDYVDSNPCTTNLPHTLLKMAYTWRASFPLTASRVN